jgi:pyruvate/2-oxoglutarate dehydrogenase complex dihydrolipoamide acyltransferase (E2) component
MIYRLAVPEPVEDVEELRVLEWHKQEGEIMQPGELVLELETHKAVVEVRSTGKAVLRRIVSAEGEWQKVGSPLAVLSDSVDEPLPENAAENQLLPVEFEII